MIPLDDFGLSRDARVPTPQVSSYADVIGRAIEEEARGDLAVLRSLGLASRIAAEARGGPPRTFLAIVPRFGLPLAPEDVHLVRFLTQALRDGPGRLILVGGDRIPPSLPPDWVVDWQADPDLDPDPNPAPLPPPRDGDLLGLVPGLIEPGMVASLSTGGPARDGDMVAWGLANGLGLIPPEYRRDPREVSRLDFDRLALAARSFGWLRAFAQFHGNNIHVDPVVLAEEARRHLAEGGVGVALRLADRAAACAGLRSTRRPSSVGAGPADRLAEVLRGGCGRRPAAGGSALATLVLMSREGMGARDVGGPPARGGLSQGGSGALGTGRSQPTRIPLHTQYRRVQPVQAGGLGGPLKLEREIEAGISGLPEPDWRLGYVNAMNIARLRRRLGDFDEAEAGYSRAFGMIPCPLSDSLSIYRDVCLAGLDGERGRHADALTGWTRAGLRWLES